MRNLAYWKEKVVECQHWVSKTSGGLQREWKRDLTYALRKVEQIERQVLK